MGARIERIPGRMGFGDCVRARFPHPKADEPGILVMGHMDTVHPVGTLAALPSGARATRCYGPGDLRHEGRQLRRARGDPAARPGRHRHAAAGDRAVHPRRGDRQPRARATSIEAEAARHRFVLVPEPAPPMAASSPAATPSRASTSRPSAGRAMPARGLPRAARRSAPWPPDHRDRGHDPDDCTFQRRRRAWRAVGQLRRHYLRAEACRWPSARPTSTAASSACWRSPARQTTSPSR